MSNLKNHLLETVEELDQESGLNYFGPAKQQAWLTHKSLHTGPVNWPNELCIYCDKEVKATQADHIQGEVNEQLREEQDND